MAHANAHGMAAAAGVAVADFASLFFFFLCSQPNMSTSAAGGGAKGAAAFAQSAQDAMKIIQQCKFYTKSVISTLMRLRFSTQRLECAC